MADLPYRSALIIGAGPGISSALARSLTGLGVIVSLGARNVEKLATLVEETGARPFTVDASQADSVAALFDRVSADTGDPEIVIFNAAAPLMPQRLCAGRWLSLIRLASSGRSPLRRSAASWRLTMLPERWCPGEANRLAA